MIRTLGAIGLAACGAFAQSAPANRAFEVASIKLHEGPIFRLGLKTAGLQLTDDADNLRGLIMFAYTLRNFEVTGAAPLLAVGDTRFDIVAKADGDAAPTRAEFRQMMRALLADRFKLKFHREMREMPVYELIVAKNGPKLKESAPDASPVMHSGPNGRNYQATIPKGTIAEVIDVIASVPVSRPVLDKTGLTGTYDIKLTYTPDTKATRDDPDLSDISIFTAIEQQLGLKLEEKKGMIEVLVIDYAEKPSSN